MKKKHTTQSAFLNLCILLGFLVFSAGALLAVFATSATGRARPPEANPPALSPATGAVTAGDIIAGSTGGGTCQYTITPGTATIVPGIPDTGNHCDDCDTLVTLPFSFELYNQTFTAVNVSSNGRLDFVTPNEPGSFTSYCVPAPPNPNAGPYDVNVHALGI